MLQRYFSSFKKSSFVRAAGSYVGCLGHRQHCNGYKSYPIRLLVQNHLAQKRFEVEKELEVGIIFLTSELKSVCEKRIDLSAAYVDIYKNELFLHQAHIPGMLDTILFML